MDEVSLIIDLLDNNWSSSATTLQSAGTISSDHIGKPNIIDIRTLKSHSVENKFSILHVYNLGLHVKQNLAKLPCYYPSNN